MTPEQQAERVARIARQYADRVRHQVPHTGHTERRLLAAVGDLIEKRLVVESGRGS